MKAQFEVDEILWGKVRVAALLKSKAIGDLLTPILEREFGGDRLRKQSLVPQEAQNEPSIRSYEVKKVEVPSGWSEPPKTPLSATPEPQKPALKEGYSWCTACGKKQVKLPLFLCNECRGDK